MRRLTWIVLVVLLATMGGGPALAQNADKCAAEKKAVSAAEMELWKAMELWLAAVDDMADAYGELTEATTKANSLALELKTATSINDAAWATFKTCRQKTPNSMCEKEYAAATTARSEVLRLQHEWAVADQAMHAAAIVLEDVKARFRAKNEARKKAEEVLEEARIALGKCMRKAF